MCGSASSLGAAFQQPLSLPFLGEEARRKPLCPSCRGGSRQQPIGLMCVCACARVSLLVGRSDVVGREVGNVSFSNKIKYFETRIWRGLFCYSFLYFLSTYVSMRTKTENLISLESQETPLSPNSSVPQFLHQSNQNNTYPVLERRTRIRAKIV